MHTLICQNVIYFTVNLFTFHDQFTFSPLVELIRYILNKSLHKLSKKRKYFRLLSIKNIRVVRAEAFILLFLQKHKRETKRQIGICKEFLKMSVSEVKTQEWLDNLQHRP